MRLSGGFAVAAVLPFALIGVAQAQDEVVGTPASDPNLELGAAYKCLDEKAMTITATLPCPEGALSLDDVRRPKLIPPLNCVDYPVQSLRAHEEGNAVISYIISPDGAATDAKLVQSSGHVNLDNAAIACMLKRKFVPAMRNGVPIAFPWQSSVNWKLG